MSNSLVEYSRAGDVFHYRWAARRCLQLVYPHAKVKEIVIEGSNDLTSEGEYVIDVTEYSDQAGLHYIDYYQLKHSTVQVNTPFTLSDLEDTITGFAKRYIEWKDKSGPNIAFSLITNRKVADSLRNGIRDIAAGQITRNKFYSTLEKYTNLTGNDLRGFSQILHLHDSEGDYDVQQDELRRELAKIVADPVDPVQIHNLVAMVQERVLPKSRNIINREDVLSRFGISSERHLYPAPTELEPKTNIIELPQYQSLRNDIARATEPVIIHAEGGVGKSVFCRYLVDSLPPESVAIIYDCFGAGKYRNRSEPRHGHRQALTQVINELASKGLCGPLIVYSTSRDEDIVRTFLDRVRVAVQSIRKISLSATLFILIDAADNAEMAAEDFNENCFVHELIREQMPIGCQLVFLCRTERVHLLKPLRTVLQFNLKPFSEGETFKNLLSWFPTASEHDGREFHRLTNANPRVQANALSAKYESVHELLVSLGPGGTSVESLIKSQLLTAVEKLKLQLSDKYQQQVDAICLSLAILPPHIPIVVLSRASKVDESTIKSFVNDIGRSLWILDSSVQFRDEPTETWFRNTFSGETSDYEAYLKLLEPLAQQSTYVAEVLPHLYLQAGQYQKLIQVSLTDDFLPTENPIDARTIRVYRLQFAFKAALKTKRTSDAIQVAIKAGEEVAGNQRQRQMLQENIELLVKLQSKEKIQEIAFKQEIAGSWNGSQDVYTASLLSGILDYQGEARGYLRSGLNWLRIALEQEEKQYKTRSHEEVRISDGDILETAYAMLNLEGVKACIDFLNHFNPTYVAGILVQLTDRLMDEGRFPVIDQMTTIGKDSIHYTVIIVSRLMQLGKISDTAIVSEALDLLCHSKSRIKKPPAQHFDHTIPRAIVAFAECCLALHLPAKKILHVLQHYIPTKANRSMASDRLSEDRQIFLKSLAIRMILSQLSELKIEEILPPDYLENNSRYDEQNEINEFKETVFVLLPWYQFRAQIIMGNKVSFINNAREAQNTSAKARSQRYRHHDPLPEEIAFICASTAVFLTESSTEDVRSFYETYLKPKNALPLSGKLGLLNAAGRLPHLASIRTELEHTTYEIVKSFKDDRPDAISSRYLSLARAVLTVDVADARFYFDHAIDIASKFGDEIVQRWEALVELADRASNESDTSDSLAYRFIRCAEIVGDNVDREKHWNRYEAMRICTKMSPGAGLSAVSRWRDRNIGSFQYEFLAVINQLLATSKIDSSLAWSGSRFFPEQINEEFLSLCLAKTGSQSLRKAFVEDEVWFNRIEGVDINYLSKIKRIAEDWIGDRNWIKDKFLFLEGLLGEQPKNNEARSVFNAKDSSTNWDTVFGALDITTTDGFSELLNRHQEIIGNEYRGNPKRNLLSECVNRLTVDNFVKFIDTLLAIDQLDRLDVQGVLEIFPMEWREKVSFPSKWNKIVRNFCVRYAYDLADSYGFHSFIRAVNADDKLQMVIIEGINEGLIDAKDLNREGTFFAYAKLSARCITDAEACYLLDYALQRFENHIESDAGDGEWSESLQPSESIDYNFAGVIWSALGSPRATERWHAVHSVRTLIDLNCKSLLDALMTWAQNDAVGAFGSQRFPFYNLHARQYLLIALARVSQYNPDRLAPYSSLLLKFAIESDHALIQRFACETCTNIEAKLPDTFDVKTVEAIKTRTNSPFPSRFENSYEFQTDSYWHANNLIDGHIEYHFAWDFESYWYEPLARVFGIPGKQVEDLAASVLANEWKSNYDGKHQSDPRSSIWNQYSSERETWHDHSSYPKADNLDFYLSYHAMLVVAGRLLQNMPILSSAYDEENAWESWLSTHLLTRTDGKWLSDHRDPAPTIRPSWVIGGQQGFDEWKSSTSDEDFIACLTSFENNGWIKVTGNWHEKKNEKIEKYHISSAFVSKISSDALMRAWATAVNSHDYKVPDYEETNMEFDADIFKLRGWITNPNNDHKLDGFDPYANKVEYPSCKIGQSFLDIIKLHADEDEKKWYNETGKCVATCESWASSDLGKDEEANQTGMSLSIDLKALQQICKNLECELIIEVSITRRLSYYYRARREDREVKNEQRRIFILNEHGKLRTT